MIQEILGCCLIKKQLIEAPEMQILIDVSEKKALVSWLHYLEKLIQREKLISANPEILIKIRNIVNMKRFEYFEDSEIQSLCNELIEYCNTYDVLSESKKRKICEEWLKDEISSRKIPTTKPEVDIKTILGYIASDFDTLCILLNQSSEPMKKEEPLSYLSTISWTIHKYPELFDTKDELIIGNASNLIQLESGNNFLERALSIISYFLGQIPEEIDFSLKESLESVQSQLDKMNESLTQFGKVNY